MAGTKKSVRPLGLESLESRELKAGNVSVSVVNEELRVVGDSNANQVEIHQSIGNVYRVTGLNGTKINGREDRLFSFKGGISVDLREGDDKFVMGGNLFEDDVHGNLNIKMGSGRDRVILGKVEVQGSTTINTDQDADQVDLDGFYNALTVNTDDGDDIVNTSGVVADRFTLNLGNGINRATLVNDLIDNRLLIQSGAQADSITTDRVLADIIDIDTAAGVDTVQLLNHTQSNELIVETGADADTVKFEQYGPFGGTVSVDTQDGDDQIIANNSLFNSNVDFVTGLGNDQVSILNSDIAGNLRVETASGDDTVDLTDVQLATNRDVTILTGDDEDIVRLNNVVADELFADLGRDRDEFRLRDSTFRIATIDGGENTDRFFDLLGNHITTLSVVNFEQFF